MIFYALILSLFVILTESSTNRNSPEFQRANGINATIDGYLPRCPGCIVFGKDPLIIYGTFHLPKDKWYILTQDPNRLTQGTFDVSFCHTGCENYADFMKWFPICLFGKNVFKPDGCKLNDVNKYMRKDCSCDDTEPMRWFAVINPGYFRKTTMIFRAIWDGQDRTKQRYFPYTTYNSIHLSDIFARGHMVMPNQRSTNRSKSWASDVLLVLTSVLLAFGTVAFFMP